MTGRDSPNRMRRQDFICSQTDHEMAMMLCRAHGVTFSELMRQLIREEFRKPRLRTETPIDDVRGGMRVLLLPCFKTPAIGSVINVTGGPPTLTNGKKGLIL
jgi:hypothetical protein